MDNENNNNRGEWIAFGILTVILIGTVIVISLLSPFIFGRAVPAILGDFLLPVETTVEPDNPLDNNVDNDDASTPEDEPSDDINNEDSSSEPDDEETKMPSSLPSSITYTVKDGQTLTAIALLHGVDVEDIIELNGITDANLIKPGDVLFIPEN